MAAAKAIGRRISRKPFLKFHCRYIEMQRWPKERAIDRGGWRYVDDFNEQDSDLSSPAGN